MTTVRAEAPAKVNLTLHVTGQREDGYHELDSLVVFAGVHDALSATNAPDLKLTLTGPGTAGVPTDNRNLVMRAAETLQKARGVTFGASITLHKHLPTAAGIGGGSSDAAATLRLLAKLWEVEPLSPSDPIVAALGADVPVCLHSPRATRMTGIGETLSDVTRLPPAALVLVNPGVAVSTQDVFKALPSKVNRAMAPLPETLDFDSFLEWLGEQRNDLMAPARALAPEIDTALAKLNALPQVKFAGMSGSGATCYGITRNMADARYAARAIQLAFGNWWVAPADILR